MKRLALYFAGIALLGNCQKADIPLTPAATAPASLTELLQRNRPAQQHFTFALGQAQAIRTAAGATLRFPANSFWLPDGRLATGQAELRVVEIYGVADMLLADQPTTTRYGQLLESGGEFHIQAWQGNVQLQMERGAANTTIRGVLTLESPRPAGQDTTRRMWLWNQQPGDTLAGWRETNATVDAVTTASFYRSSIPLDSLGWWNIDQVLEPAPPTVVYVRVPTGATQTCVYLRPQGNIRNSLAQLSASAPDQTDWTRPMPTGMPVLAIVLQARAGKLYFAPRPPWWQMA